MRKILLATIVLAGLTGCTSAFVNLADNGRYRVLGDWPLLCHSDGSVILLQKANASATFNAPTETPGPCTPAEDHAWTYLDEMDRPRDYRLLGITVALRR